MKKNRTGNRGEARLSKLLKLRNLCQDSMHTKLLCDEKVSRIYALLSSNPPEYQDWGKGGGVKPIWAMPRF